MRLELACGGLVCWNRRHLKHLFGGTREQPRQQELEGLRAQGERRPGGELSFETASNSKAWWPGTQTLDKTGHRQGFKAETLASRAHQAGFCWLPKAAFCSLSPLQTAPATVFRSADSPIRQGYPVPCGFREPGDTRQALQNGINIPLKRVRSRKKITPGPPPTRLRITTQYFPSQFSNCR